jgi:hypothetical protein
MATPATVGRRIVTLDDCELPEVQRAVIYLNGQYRSCTRAMLWDALTALYEKWQEVQAERDFAIDMYAPAREREQTLALLRSTLEAHHELPVAASVAAAGRTRSGKRLS